LLDMGFIRVGNQAYKDSNNVFGATTLRDRHAEIEGDSVTLNFVGKGGKDRDLTLVDEELAMAMRDARDVPGGHLFQYYDAEGDRHALTSDQVNAYMRETMGEEFSAKNFRTWHASVLAYAMLCEADERPTISAVLDTVSERLGNTPAIARKSYIHPAVIEVLSRENGWEAFKAELELPRRTRYHTRFERGLLKLLQETPPAQELLAA